MAVFGRSYPIKPIIAPVKLSSGKSVAGVVANISVSAPAGSIAIYSAPSIPFPNAPALPEPLNYISAFIGLRQQYTIQPLVPVPGSSSGVTVSAQAGSISIYQNNNPQQPFSPQLPSSLQFNPSSFALRQQYNTATPDVFESGSTANVNVAAQNGTATELIDGVGQTANVNAVAQPGSIVIYQTEFPQYPFPPLLNNSIQFVSQFIGLRQQYNTASPDVFVSGSVANVNVTAQFADEIVTESVVGTVSNVNAVAQPGSINIYQIENQPFPFSPLLPPELQFNPAYKTLRQQYNTGTPIPLSGVVGAVANVNVSGQPDNSLLETISGTASNVNVAAPSGIVTIYTEVFPTFPQPPILPSILRFNPAYLTLRQQYNTALPDVFVPGSVANVNVSSPNGTVTESVSTTVNVTVSSPSDESVTVVVVGSVANVSVSSTGATVNSIQGTSASVNVVANPPFPPIEGPTVQVTVSAHAGSLRYINNTTWWRVYRGYANWPTW